ncbi:hypothetical protein ABZW18_30570 [Streptomyces sp. NPDC004647]|uniref:hypothetical protein n=1 Tax=Streptomyces sp. NPDC004647 TaxID=3154671 RepID=UPI0033B6E6C1
MTDREGPAGTDTPARLGTRLAVLCSVADQGVAALTNIVVLVVAARLSSAAGFSVFSLVYTVFTVLLGLSVSYVGQALVLERGTSAGVRGACCSAVVFTACASTATGGLMAAVLFLVPGGDTARGLAVLGLVLPVVLTQDAMRYCFSTLHLPHFALTADLVRLAAAVPALAVQPQGAGPARLVAVWGLSAIPALAVGAALLAPRLRGVPADSRRFLRRGHLGKRFVLEFAVGNAAGQLAIVGLGLFAAPLAVGALRGVTTLFGPMNVLFNASTAFGPPILNRYPDASRKVRATALLAAALAAVAALWATVLITLPDRLGRELLGDTWAASSALLPATGSQYAAMGLGTCALLTLRVLRPRATLPIQVVFSLLSVAFMLTGYAQGGVLGAAWGLCLGSVLKGSAAWLRIVSVRREALLPSEAAPDGSRGGRDRRASGADDAPR